ncbi:STT3 domain-containing protein [Campylobacter sputorum]|uniref:STT3 domain-containing protein n=1 Tax=Campylobacter sputorum TaxID=206 RepID=UPI00053BEAD3|nr:STT3 domain-containing protein [Campylobacter sputorum]
MSNFNFAKFLNKLPRLSKHTILMIVLAVCFGIFCRFYWVVWASAYPHFIWNDELMISTNDGYAFAEGTRDMIAGFHQPNDLSYYGSSLSTLSMWLYSILPFSLETILLYMSTFLSPLLAVPLILIGKELNASKAGFIAALLAVVANSYYNRTMSGYYDTDMLNITLPMMVFWSITRLVQRKERVNLIFIPVFMAIYGWWYPSSYSLLLAMIGMFVLYTIVFERYEKLNYEAMVFMILAITSFPIQIKFIIVIILYALIYFYQRFFDKKVIFALIIASSICFIWLGGLNPILFNIKFYIFRDIADSGDTVFKFFNVNQTIRESSAIDFNTVATRISGHLIVFLVSIVGYILFIKNNKILLLTLPILFLGLMSFKSGLRFTIYSVPVMALGFGYFVMYCFTKIDIKDRFLGYAFLFVVTFSALYPSLKHIYDYKVFPVFTHSEVESLDDLKNIAKREDYVLSWWDYGYPIRYYSDVKTLIDGGKHLGSDNFAVSFALGSDQNSSANMARLEVEYTERNYEEKFGLNLKQIMKDYNATNVNEFLLSLKDANLALPKQTRDIYYYLPDRMIYIYPTVLAFSRLDLTTGQEFAEPFFIVSERFSATNDNQIMLNNNVILSSDGTKLSINGNSYSVNTYVETSYDQNEKLNVNYFNIDPNSNFYVIFMKDYLRILVLDKTLYDSAYIQLFVLENYDKNLFEPVILNGSTKIYKLKK